MVMKQDGMVAYRDRSAEKAFGERDVLASECKGLCIAPIERGGELKGEIVAEAILSKGVAVTIGDLASWRRDPELECPCLFLGLPGRLGILINGSIRPVVHLGMGQERGSACAEDEYQNGASAHDAVAVALSMALGEVMCGGFR